MIRRFTHVHERLQHEEGGTEGHHFVIWPHNIRPVVWSAGIPGVTARYNTIYSIVPKFFGFLQLGEPSVHGLVYLVLRYANILSKECLECIIRDISE